MIQKPVLYEEDGGERELPFKWQICCRCQGHGKSSAYLGAFTREQLEEEGPEFMEEYFSGGYDRTCETCGGSGKVPVVDRKRCSKADLEEYDRTQAEMAECREIERQERLMEGGWREEGWFQD